MIFGNNQKPTYQQKKMQQQAERRRQWAKTEMEDVFGDMMDEMGM